MTDPRRYPIPGTRQSTAFAATHEIGAARDAQRGGDPAQNIARTAREQHNPDGEYIEIPAFYNIVIPNLGPNTGDDATGDVTLRPEDFVCERITWAALQDLVAILEAGSSLSFIGRSVEVAWGDEFTRFLNKDPALISAAFGDSNGFLDFPNGIRFQGKQTLSVTCRRVLGVGEIEVPGRIDFTLHGFGLLPRGSGGYSGGAQ